MQNMTHEDMLKDIDYPIGTFPGDFASPCLDCIKPDYNNAFTYRESISEVHRDQPLKKMKLENGKFIHLYPSTPGNYCYYHAKCRGLLPYQKGKKWTP